MSNRDDNRRRGRSFWTALIFGPAIWCAGCATAPAPEPEVSTEDLAALTQRVEDVERINARLTVRVEESERQHLLLQDRVESNRIALQRRGYLSDDRGRYVRRAEPERSARNRERPEPTPESSYRQGGQYQADPSMEQRMERRGVTRIPLSNGQAGVAEEEDEESANRRAPVAAEPDSGAADEGEEIVLTNEILEQRYGTRPRSQERSRERETRSGRETSAQEPVTDERLATSSELDDQRQASESNRERARQDSDSQALSSDEKTELYQDSLATYRAGDYAEALAGFERFLNADPRQDYVDNALYWIGECQYGLGRYEEAISYFERITDDMPSAGKVPDAMLKMSMAYDQINQPEEAVRLLRALIADHATTNPGRLGQERLEEHPLAQNE